MVDLASEGLIRLLAFRNHQEVRIVFSLDTDQLPKLFQLFRILLYSQPNNLNSATLRYQEDPIR